MMKFIVDKLPNTCGDCKYCAAAMMMSPLGVQKEVALCTIQATLLSPTDAQQEPNILDVKKSPAENKCPCTEGVDKNDGKGILDII